MSNLVNRDSLKKHQEKNKVVIHVMPKRFHFSQREIKKAKNTGLIIIFLGIVFLILILVFVYFYFFRNQNNNQNNNQTSPILNVDQKNQQREDDQNNKKSINSKRSSKNNLNNNQDLKEETIKAKNKIITSSSTASSSKIIKIENFNKPIASSTIPEKIITNISDKDKDGLNDKEEVLFGCNLNSVDSDKDGYDDKQELDSFYNPAGSGKIEDSPFIRRYNNENYQYSFLLPVSLSVKKFGGDNSLIINLSKNEFIQIIVQLNKEKDNILTWYQKQFDRTPNNQIFFNNWQGVRNNNFIVYLSDNNKRYIVTINYNSGIDNLMTYPNVFNLIIKSFRFDYD